MLGMILICYTYFFLILIAIYRPKTPQELYNLCHAQARNIIERIFGVIKKHWVILTLPAHYDMTIQAHIPAALAAVHNYIIEHDPFEVPELQNPNFDIDPMPGQHVDADDVGELGEAELSNEEKERASAKGDSIAQAMWVQYQEVLAQAMDVDN